jgi:hypothetical protein
MALVLTGSNALLRTWEQMDNRLVNKSTETQDPARREGIKLVREVATQLINGLKRRYGPQDFVSDDNQPFLIACFLHPAYKNLMFIPEQKRNNVIGHVKTWIRQQLSEKFPDQLNAAPHQPNAGDAKEVEPTSCSSTRSPFPSIPLTHSQSKRVPIVVSHWVFYPFIYVSVAEDSETRLYSEDRPFGLRRWASPAAESRA